MFKLYSYIFNLFLYYYIYIHIIHVFFIYYMNIYEYIKKK